MRKTNVAGKALNLKHEHFTITQYDLLDFTNSLLKSALGTTEQATPTLAKCLTSIISYSNGTLSWTDGWCVIAGQIRVIKAGSVVIDQEAENVTYYFEAENNVISKYNYKQKGSNNTINGCTEYTVKIGSNLTNFLGFDIQDKITICGRSATYSENMIVNFANRYYSVSRINNFNAQRVSQTLDGISASRKRNNDSVLTFYIEVSDWNMDNDLSKTIYYPSHVLLDEGNTSVMSYSFHFVSDNNDQSRNSGYTCKFYQDHVIITLSELQGYYYSGTGFRGILKIEAYSYCHVPE